MAEPTALVIGGSGQIGPLIVRGLIDRGYEVVVLHGGQHEHPDLPEVEHIHVDPHFAETLEEGLRGRNFDLAIAMYGRTRLVCDALVGRCPRLIAVSGTAHAYFDRGEDRWGPLGQTVVDERSPFARTKDDRLSYSVGKTEEYLLSQHARGAINVSIVRFPEVYGPDSRIGRDWSIIRRILDRRPYFILPDGGLRLCGRLYRDNAAEALLAVVDRQADSAGEVYTAADSDAGVTLGQIAAFFAQELGHEWELVSMPAVLASSLYADLCIYHRQYDVSKISGLGYVGRVGVVDALRETAHWWATHPPERGGPLEIRMGDEFDYDREDRTLSGYKAAIAELLESGDQAVAAHPYRHPRAIGEEWRADTSERIVRGQRDSWPFPLWRPSTPAGQG